MLNSFKYFFCLLLVMISLPSFAQEEDEDTIASVESLQHQLALSIDVVQPIVNSQVDLKKSYEAAIDYYWRKDIYFVLEGGFGSSVVNYPDLAYQSRNTFFRAGINKSLLPRLKPNDWDMAFLGLRFAAAPINISNVSYTVVDSVWGNNGGIIPDKDFTGYWFEIVAGMRVELIRNFSAGWTMRGKFLLNSKQFRDLAPVYVAGYGKGDKNGVFDFNVYLTYAIRWNK